MIHQVGWNHRDATMFDADEFTVYQLGYARHADSAKDRNRCKRRLFELRQLLREFERRDLIRPHRPWGGYFSRQNSGVRENGPQRSRDEDQDGGPTSDPRGLARPNSERPRLSSKLLATTAHHLIRPPANAPVRWRIG